MKRLLLTTLSIMFLCGNAFAAAAIASIPGMAENNNVVWSYPTVREAEKNALSECQKDAHAKGVKTHCKIAMSIQGPGFVAIAYGDNGTGYGSGATSQEAVDNAAAACSQKFKNCQTENIHYWEDRSLEKTDAPSCIPKTSHRQCKSTCNNGDCLLIYTNSCKVRVQVSPQFNSFTNQWEYPSPNC